jgi:hypothetical protein
MGRGDIARQRLRRQRLVGEPFASEEEAVEALGAVQAQDFAGAKWGLGMRVKGATDASLTGEFDAGRFLRTHVLRPTWHFVVPRDIRWMLRLTAPRVRAAMAHYFRQSGVDQRTVGRGNEALLGAMAGGRQLTRTEVAAVFRRKRIDPSGLRLGFLLMAAELEGVVCSGRLRGKQQTYALLDERAPAGRELDGDEALGEMVRRYFRGHGPAQVQDLAWWAGLTVAQVKRGLAVAARELEWRAVEGKTYWFAEWPVVRLRSAVAHLLPNYDEYFIAYKDRSAAFDPGRLRKDPTGGAFLSHIVVLNGQIVGGWRRQVERRAMAVTPTLLVGTTAAERAALAAAVARYGQFLQVDGGHRLTG